MYLRVFVKKTPALQAILNQVKTYSKVLFPALVIKLNEQCPGSVLSKKTGLLTRYTKTGYYKTQALNTKHVVTCAKNHWTTQTWGNPPSEAELSTLPDNPGDTRFWTASPSLQVRV